MEKQKIIQIIIDYLKHNQIIEIGIFGSFARNEMKPESDIDVLVKYPRGISLLDIVRMKIELSEKTGKNIDLVSVNAVKPDVLKYIKKDLQLVYRA